MGLDNISTPIWILLTVSQTQLQFEENRNEYKFVTPRMYWSHESLLTTMSQWRGMIKDTKIAFADNIGSKFPKNDYAVGYKCYYAPSKNGGYILQEQYMLADILKKEEIND